VRDLGRKDNKKIKGG
jgi:uncharacterized protein with WD repeat